MKFFFAKICCLILLIQTSVVFAANIVEPPSSGNESEPAIVALSAFHRWLYSEGEYATGDAYQDSWNSGVHYINGNLNIAYQNALKWDSDSKLYYVHIFSDGSSAGNPTWDCDFQFGSVKKPYEIFNAHCGNISGQLQAPLIFEGYPKPINIIVSPSVLFDSPRMKLRNFVESILNSPPTLMALQDDMKGTSSSEFSFHLSMVSGRPLWELRIFDPDTVHLLSMVIEANADMVNNSLRVRKELMNRR